MNFIDGKLGAIVENSASFSKTRGNLLGLVESHGAVLFRKFVQSEEGFNNFSNILSENHFQHGTASVRPPSKTDKSIVGVLVGNQKIELHGEMYYQPFQPDYLWLYCEHPPETGGETTICDGKEFWRQLSDNTKKIFESKKIKFTQNWHEEGWKAITGLSNIDEAVTKIKNQPYVQSVENSNEGIVTVKIVRDAFIKDDKSHEKSFINSILVIRQYRDLDVNDENSPCFEDDSPISNDIFNELIEIGDRTMGYVKWQKNDILLVDNRRFMHGRMPFDSERIIFTRFSKVA